MIKRILIIAAALAVVPLSLLILQIFRVEAVECRVSSQSQCPESLSVLLDEALVGQPLFLADFPSLLAGEQFSSQPFTFKSIEKRLPSTATITFELEPLLYLIRTQEGEQVAVGANGSVIPTQNWPDDTPTVQINESSENIIAADNINLEYHQPLALLINSLYKNQIVFQNITWNSADEIRLESPGMPLVIIDSANPDLAISKLQLIINSGKIEALEEPISEIDLRFKMPVLRTHQ